MDMKKAVNMDYTCVDNWPKSLLSLFFCERCHHRKHTCMCYMESPYFQSGEKMYGHQGQIYIDIAPHLDYFCFLVLDYECIEEEGFWIYIQVDVYGFEKGGEYVLYLCI